MSIELAAGGSLLYLMGDLDLRRKNEKREPHAEVADAMERIQAAGDRRRQREQEREGRRLARRGQIYP